MTSATDFGAWQEHVMFAGAWRRSPKLGRRVGARVTSNECQNLGFCRAVDEEAVMVARVPRRRSESHESEAARGNFPELVSARRGA